MVMGAGNAWVVFAVGEYRAALRASAVRELIELELDRTTLATTGAERGIYQLRGEAIGMLDLRAIFGLEPRHSELEASIASFRRGKQDHIRWLEALKAAVLEGTEFQGALDPRQCAFGRWHSQFKTKDPALLIRLILFKAPHERIHAIAEGVLSLARGGQRDEALRIIRETAAGDLAVIIQLFDETMPLLTRVAREVVMLLAGEAKRAFVVDAVDSVEEVEPDEVKPLSEVPLWGAFDDICTGIVERDGKRILLLDCERILARHRASTTTEPGAASVAED